MVFSHLFQWKSSIVESKDPNGLVKTLDRVLALGKIHKVHGCSKCFAHQDGSANPFTQTLDSGRLIDRVPDHREVEASGCADVAVQDFTDVQSNPHPWCGLALVFSQRPQGIDGGDGIAGGIQGWTTHGLPVFVHKCGQQTIPHELQHLTTVRRYAGDKVGKNIIDEIKQVLSIQLTGQFGKPTKVTKVDGGFQGFTVAPVYLPIPHPFAGIRAQIGLENNAVFKTLNEQEQDRRQDKL